jgi:arylsulfatase A-like enzyme
MFTGRYRRELSTSWTAPLDGTTPTLAEALSARGYITAGFVANLSYCRRETGLDRGFAYFDDYPVSLGEMLISSTLVRRISHNHRVRRLFGYYDTIGRKTAEIINEDFLGWLSRQNGKPFFAFLNYFDAHEPYLPPSPFDAKFGQPSVRKNYRITHRLHDAERMDKERMGPEEVQAELDAYDGAIAYLDHTLGKLFDELEKRNLLDNTLVIITSDHGEQFGEHGRFGHGNSLALQSLRVPLVIRFPSRVPAGVTVSEAISLRDIPSTVADLLNLEGAPAFPGRSLARYWNGKGEQEGESSLPVLAELFSSGFTPEHEWKGAKVSLLAKGKQYIRNGDGSEELYDLERDPAALHDISRDKESGLALSAFRKIFEGYNRYQVRAHQLSRP